MQIRAGGGIAHYGGRTRRAAIAAGSGRRGQRSSKAEQTNSAPTRAGCADSIDSVVVAGDQGPRGDRWLVEDALRRGEIRGQHKRGRDLQCGPMRGRPLDGHTKKQMLVDCLRGCVLDLTYIFSPPCLLNEQQQHTASWPLFVLPDPTILQNEQALILR
jgi:hypothetical protein